VATDADDFLDRSDKNRPVASLFRVRVFRYGFDQLRSFLVRYENLNLHLR
jgi:hypothetical protein